MTAAAKHPNRIPFDGVLTRLDEPSDKAPNGSRGHRVILPVDVAEEAIPTLIGMAVAFNVEWDGHNPRQKCGVITAAWVEGKELLVAGHLYGRDFPEVAAAMLKPGVSMGMSYEMVDAHVEDMRKALWTLSKVTFTGAAILLRDKAAYRTSRFNISASEEQFTGKLTFVGTSIIKIASGRHRSKRD